MNNKVKITFLGGVGEIGKNMTAIECNDEIIVIDAGLTFPGEDLPGVDIVIPDITYLKTNKDKVKAILLTHGHEDHIGALPFVLNQLNVPIYGSRLTLALVESKMKELQEKYAELMQNEVARSYFELELRFNVMLADVNKIIAESIQDVLK